MITEVTACPKHLATHLTAEFETFVTHVDNRMLFKQAGTGECLLTNLAVVNGILWGAFLLWKGKQKLGLELSGLKSLPQAL